MDGIVGLARAAARAAAIEEALFEVLGAWARSANPIDPAERIAWAEACARHGELADRWQQRRPDLPATSTDPFGSHPDPAPAPDFPADLAPAGLPAADLAHLVERAERAHTSSDRHEVARELLSLARHLYESIQSSIDARLDRPTWRLLTESLAALDHPTNPA